MCPLHIFRLQPKDSLNKPPQTTPCYSQFENHQLEVDTGNHSSKISIGTQLGHP